MGKKIFRWYEKKKKVIKTIFILSVIVLIVSEIMNIVKNISGDKLAAAFSGVGWFPAILMGVIGLVCVLPMVLYDFVFVQLIGQTFSKGYILKTSFAINTINNVVDMGGIASIELRKNYYGRDVSDEDMAEGVSKLFLFILTGIPIYSVLALAATFFAKHADYIQQYMIWLIGGILYFPVVLVIAHLAKNKFKKPFLIKQQVAIIGTSFLEWTGVFLCFFSIGWLMKIPFSVVELLPILVAASIIGLISMIPGGLGSFDIIVILGLTSVGYDQATVVAWILLYRLFYYFIPFLLGFVYLVRHSEENLNERFDGLPKSLGRELSHKLLVFLLYFSGVMLVLSATIPEFFVEHPFFSRINPLMFHFISTIPNLVIGFLLILVGRGIAARVKKIFIPTIVMLGITICFTIVKDFSWGIILFLCLLAVFVLFSKKELYREQLVYSWEMMAKDGVIVAVLTILYLVIGIYNLPHTGHARHRTLDFLFFPSEKIWISGLFTILVVLLFTYFFMRYLSLPRKKMGQALDEQRVYSVLQQYGGDEDSHLVFLKDKDVYFYQNEDQEDTVVFSFQTYNNKCMVMGMPFGKKDDFYRAIDQFMEEADRYGYQLLFYDAKESLIPFLHDHGYDFMKMGEEALVELENFSISGKKNRGLRAIVNRFEREKYQFKMVEPPFSDEFLAELRKISDDWLNGRKEKGYSLGFFADDYLQKAPIGIVEDEQGSIIAFANTMPMYGLDQATIDMMRHYLDAPTGVMDYLFISLYLYYRDQKVGYFNLGMSPLSNVGVSRNSFLEERLAYLVFHFGSRFYSFQGLRSYKQKFASVWVPKYTFYPKDSYLLFDMIQLLIISDQTIEDEKEK